MSNFVAVFMIVYETMTLRELLQSVDAEALSGPGTTDVQQHQHGADDMPAHAKSTLSGVSITIPITDGHLNLGTWQGIYFCEYRNYGGSRELVVTIIGE